MPFDSNGNFTRVRNWQSDDAAKIKIRADYHDSHDADIAAGLSTTLTKDGRTQPTANLPLNNHRLIALADPVDPQDAVTKKYVDSIKNFTTSISMAGADLNGQIQFTSPTGSQGLAFTGADLSWLAKIATAAGPGTPPNPAATLNRLVLNTKPDGTGTDVITCNDDGTLSTAGAITSAGQVNATSVLAVKATTGNVHTWFYGPANEDRMVIYTASASMGHGFLRVNGTQTFAFQNDGMFKAPSRVYSGASWLETNANLYGSAWGGWLSDYIESRANAYAANKVGIVRMQRVSNTYSGNVGDQNGWQCPGGSVIVGYARVAGQSGAVYGLYYMYLQIYDDKNGWRAMEG